MAIAEKKGKIPKGFKKKIPQYKPGERVEKRIYVLNKKGNLKERTKKKIGEYDG